MVASTRHWSWEGTRTVAVVVAVAISASAEPALPPTGAGGCTAPPSKW